MELDQAAKTIAWLDDERRKDKKEITSLQERVAALAAENQAFQRRLQELESGLNANSKAVQRVTNVDGLLEANRKEMARQIDDNERRHADANKEDERLRKLERDAINKSLADLRKPLDLLPRLERDVAARKEEEARVARLIAELQLKVADFNKHVDDRNRAVVVLDEGRRTDTKRIGDLQTDTADLRKRVDDSRGKVDILEDMIRRTDARLAEVFISDNERRLAQAQWIEAQSKVLTTHERAFEELRVAVEVQLKNMDDYARRVDQYADAFREMRRVVDEARQIVDIIERRVTESAEVHRLAEEKFRQDWSAFMADDQKRWTTHMLLGDEQWREHDRQSVKQSERLQVIEEQLAELAATVRQVQTVDATRMQTLLNVVRELAADYDPSLVRVK